MPHGDAKRCTGKEETKVSAMLVVHGHMLMIRVVKETPIDYELNVRVQALESLIRSGSTLDHSSASTAAMETILHATRAAESGSQDASSALAQLTEAMSGGGIGNMSQDAQSSLLMDVLQQVSS